MGEDTIVFLNLGWEWGGGFTLLFNKDMLMRVDLVVGLLCYLLCTLLANKYNGLKPIVSLDPAGGGKSLFD